MNKATPKIAIHIEIMNTKRRKVTTALDTQISRQIGKKVNSLANKFATQLTNLLEELEQSTPY